nr:hypothetical protein ECPA41_1065 [Escherichia coli PA41]
MLLAENIPTADYQFNTFFSNAFETDVKNIWVNQKITKLK